MRHAIPSWTTISVIGRLSVMRSLSVFMVLVPSLAHVLEAAGFDANALPANFVVWYLGAWAFAAGSLIFVARCPRIVKESNDFAEFQAQGRGPVELIATLLDIHRDLKEPRFLELAQDVLALSAAEVAGGVPVVLAALRAMKPSVHGTLSEGYWKIRTSADRSRLAARAMVTGCFTIAVLCAVCVAVRNAIFVATWWLERRPI